MLLLTHGYFLAQDKKEQQIMKPYPPLGILSISAFLHQHHISNTLFDTTFSSKSDLESYLVKNKPEIVALYTNIITKLNVLSIIKFIRSSKELLNTIIILGGPDITYNIENYLNNNIDFLVIGEGEQTMLELVNAIRLDTDITKVDGIAFKKQNKIIQNRHREKIKDISTLPHPNRKGIDLQKYLDVWSENHGKNAISVSTQRGCPYTCKWCSTAVYGQSYRRRSAKSVVEELVWIKQNYKPDTIWFVDDVFTVSHKWIQDFYLEMKKYKLKISFECITRAERLNDEILQFLKEIGCFRIWIGAESGSQRIIDNMDRRVDIEVVKSVIQKTNEIGIESGTFIMVGYPGENESDINKTIQYLKDANPTHYTITIAYPIKGTSLYLEIEDKIIGIPNWETSTDRDIDFRRTYSRKFYDYAVIRIINEVNQHREKQKGNHMNSLKLKTKSIVANLLMKVYT